MSHPRQSANEDFNRALARVCEVAVKFGPAEHSGIVVFDADKTYGVVQAEFPPHVGAVQKIIPFEGITAEQDLINTAKPIAIKHVEQDQTLGPVKDILLGLGIKSLLVVPVVVDGQVKASFSFDWMSSPQQFSPFEIDRCRSLAELVALIFKNGSLLEKTKDQAEKLEALREAMLAITREHQREPLLETILEQAVKLLKVTHGGIYEFNHHRNVLEVIADYNRPDRVGLTLGLGEGMAGRLFVSADEFMRTSDYSSWEGRATSLGADAAFGSVLEVPLLWKTERTGVLYVDDVPGRVFTEQEARLLQRFAATSSIALEHSRVTESDHYKLERLESLASATNEIVSHINSPDVDARLTEIARYAHEILNAEACGIHQVRRPGYLTLVASDGHRPGGFDKGREFEITSGHGTGLTGHIAYVGKTFNECGSELGDHFAAKKKEQDTSPTGSCHSLLAVPLKKKSGDEEIVTGLLRISNKKNKAGESHPWVCFSKADEYIAEIFAQAATVVLDTTELVDEIRTGKDRYENLLKACNTIVKARTLEDGLQRLAALLIRILNKSFCRVFLINEKQKWLYIMAAEQHETAANSFQWEPKVGEMADIGEWRGLEKQLKRGEAMVLRYQDADHRDNLGRLSQKLNIRNFQGEMRTIQSMYSIPLKVGHRTVGLINVGELRCGPRGDFTLNEQELAKAIAAQATLIIDKAQHEEMLDKLRHRNEALFRSIERLRNTHTVDELLRVIVAQGAEIFSKIAGMIIQTPARRGLLLLIDCNGRSIDLPTASLADLAGFLGRTSRAAGSAIEYDFKAARHEEAFLLDYEFNIVLATHISFASSHCLLFVGDDAPRSELGRADLEILERLGHHSGISLSKAAAQEQVNKARDGAYLVAEAMALGDTDVVLEKAVEGIRKSVDCDSVTLYVLDRRTGKFTFPPELAGVDDKVAAQKLLWDEQESVMKRIDGIDQYHPADDTREDPLMDGSFVRREGIVSSAAVPTFSQNEKMGVLFVNYRRPHHFDEADEKNLKFLAHQVAVAIRNLQQFNTMKLQETSLNALYQTERLIASFTDLTDTLKQIAKQVWDVANSNTRKTNVVSINLIENKRARVVASYPPHELQHIKKVLKGEVDLVAAEKVGLVGVAFQGRLSTSSAERTRVFRDLKNNSHYIALHDDTQSELVALIEDETSTILGAIAVENSDENAFDERDQNVIETLASQAGEAIRKDRQARALHHSIRQNARLQAVSLAGLSLSISRHEIHNLCLMISENADACLRGARGVGRLIHKRELETIHDCAKQLLDKPSTAPLDFAQGRLHERVNELIHKHLAKLRQDVRLKVDFKHDLDQTPETKIWINRDWFNRALGLFTRNSLREMTESRSRVLTLRTRIIENYCRIEIDDTGPGIDFDVWEKLFEDPVVNHGSNGQGVGLLVARTIVEFHGGRVHKIANAKDGGGITTLGFSLPISSASDKQHK